MRKRGIRFILLMSLVASACSTASRQTMETTISNETTSTLINSITASTINENSDNKSSDQITNTEEEIGEFFKNTEYFKDFS